MDASTATLIGSILVALIGIAAPVVKSMINRDRSRLETQKIYDELEERRAARLRSEMERVEQECRDLETELQHTRKQIQDYRKRLIKHHIDPDNSGDLLRKEEK